MNLFNLNTLKDIVAKGADIAEIGNTLTGGTNPLLSIGSKVLSAIASDDTDTSEFMAGLSDLELAEFANKSTSLLAKRLGGKG